MFKKVFVFAKQLFVVMSGGWIVILTLASAPYLYQFLSSKSDASAWVYTLLFTVSILLPSIWGFYVMYRGITMEWVKWK